MANGDIYIKKKKSVNYVEIRRQKKKKKTQNAWCASERERDRETTEAIEFKKSALCTYKRNRDEEARDEP